jgi:hypothetical protein
MSDTAHYNEMFDYLSTVPAPQESAGLLVFGRADALVAHAAGKTVMEGLGDFVVISGGVGKDSGNLKVPEATFLQEELHSAYPDLHVPVFTDTLATNGGDNVRNSLGIMDSEGLPYQNALTGVAHATSLRRLTEIIRHEAIKRGTPIEVINGVPTAYKFDAENPADQAEARAELLRLADWPDKGWLQPQSDVPANLVDFARDVNPH